MATPSAFARAAAAATAPARRFRPRVRLMLPPPQPAGPTVFMRRATTTSWGSPLTRSWKSYSTRTSSAAPASSDSPLAPIPPKRKGLWGFIARFIEGPDEIRVDRAKKTLTSIEEQSRQDFRVCGVNQDKFRSQFALEMLHLWILKLNLVGIDKVEGARQFAEICEQVWAKSEYRLHNEGIHTLMLSRNLKDLQQWTFGSMTAYDQAIITLQDKDNDADFIGALWRNVYDCDQDAKLEHVVTLGDYAINQIHQLQESDQKLIFAGDIPWIPPPNELSRTQDELNLEQYGTPTVVPGKESKIIEFRWSSEYPLVR